MFPTMFPQMMYHATEPARSVKDQKEKDALTRQGWSDRYIFKSFPKMIYHAELEPRAVAAPQELAKALAEGWSTEHELVLRPDAQIAGDKHLPVARAKAEPAEA